MVDIGLLVPGFGGLRLGPHLGFACWFERVLILKLLNFPSPQV